MLIATISSSVFQATVCVCLAIAGLSAGAMSVELFRHPGRYAEAGDTTSAFAAGAVLLSVATFTLGLAVSLGFLFAGH